MGEIRECRLRAEFAHLYEGMPAGVWQAAPVVAEQLVLRARKGRMQQIQQRTFDQRHFEFRGGPAAPERPRSARTRRGEQGSPPTPSKD